MIKIAYYRFIIDKTSHNQVGTMNYVNYTVQIVEEKPVGSLELAKILAKKFLTHHYGCVTIEPRHIKKCNHKKFESDMLKNNIVVTKI